MKLMIKKIFFLGLVLSCSLGSVFGMQEGEEKSKESENIVQLTPEEQVKSLINSKNLDEFGLIKAIADGAGIVPESTRFSRKRTRTEVLRSTKNESGDTLMHKAAELGSGDAMKTIVAGLSFSEKEHPLNRKNNEGNTPFHIAVKDNRSSFLEEALSLYAKTTRSLFGLRSGGTAAVQRALMMKNGEDKSVFDLSEELSLSDPSSEIPRLIAQYKPMSRLKKAMYAGAGIAGVGLTAYGIYQLARNPEVQKLYQQALKSGYFKDIKSFIKAGISFMGTAYIKSSRNVRDYVNALREFVAQRGREVVAKAIARMNNLIASLNGQSGSAVPENTNKFLEAITSAATEAIKVAEREEVSQITNTFLEGITSAAALAHMNPDVGLAEAVNNATEALMDGSGSVQDVISVMKDVASSVQEMFMESVGEGFRGDIRSFIQESLSS